MKRQTGSHLKALAVYKESPACVLAGVAQWIENQPVNQKVTSSIPGHDLRAHALVVGQVPCWRGSRGNELMFFSLSFSLPSHLSKNK